VTSELAPPSRRCLDREEQGRIDAITETLVKTLPEERYPFRVIVANNPTVNALAAPGGFIVVFRGLLERTESAEELAGVLAHEIQHVMHRHSTKAILRQAGAGVLMAALVGDVSAVVAFGLQSARTLGDLRYSRQAELEADRDGMRMLHAAAVDPAGMLSFFQAMQREEGTPQSATRYLSTHPAAVDRLQALTTLAAARTRPPAKLLPSVDWNEVTKMCGARSGSDRGRGRRGPARR
jgi:beta-barrel assembly-enhancing protease